MKGRLTSDITAWCGRCVAWEFTGLSRRKAAARFIRDRGWKLTEADGWVCPKCAKPTPGGSSGEVADGGH